MTDQTDTPTETPAEEETRTRAEQAARDAATEANLDSYRNAPAPTNGDEWIARVLPSKQRFAVLGANTYATDQFVELFDATNPDELFWSPALVADWHRANIAESARYLRQIQPVPPVAPTPAPTPTPTPSTAPLQPLDIGAAIATAAPSAPSAPSLSGGAVLHGLPQTAPASAPAAAPAPVVTPVNASVSAAPENATVAAALPAAIAVLAPAIADAVAINDRYAAGQILAQAVVNILEPHMNPTGRSLVEVLRAMFGHARL